MLQLGTVERVNGKELGWCTLPPCAVHSTRSRSLQEGRNIAQQAKLQQPVQSPKAGPTGSFWPFFDAGSGSFQPGYTEAPVQWGYLEEKFEMRVMGGVFGEQQGPSTHTPSPVISWAMSVAGMSPSGG